MEVNSVSTILQNLNSAVTVRSPAYGGLPNPGSPVYVNSFPTLMSMSFHAFVGWLSTRIGFHQVMTCFGPRNVKTDNCIAKAFEKCGAIRYAGDHFSDFITVYNVATLFRNSMPSEYRRWLVSMDDEELEDVILEIVSEHRKMIGCVLDELLPPDREGGSWF